MRSALLFALVIAAGCSDGPNRTEFTNLERQTLMDRERLLALETGNPPKATLWSDVAELRQQVAALAAENQSLKSEMAKVTAARKVPHLVSRDTGVDYGVSIDGALAAWDEAHAAVVDYSLPRDTYFTGDHCDGMPLLGSNINVEARFTRYVFIGDGRLVRATSAKRFDAPGGSVLAYSGECSPLSGVSGFPAVEAAFSLPRARIASTNG